MKGKYIFFCGRSFRCFQCIAPLIPACKDNVDALDLHASGNTVKKLRKHLNDFKPLRLQVRLYSGKCMCLQLSAAGKVIILPSIIHPKQLCFLPLLHIGTSLLQEVVYLVSQGADPDEIGLMNIDEQLPVLEYPQPGLEIIQVFTLSHAHIYWTNGLQHGNDIYFYPLTSWTDKVLCFCRNWHRLVWSKATCRTVSCPQRCTMEKARSAGKHD